MRPMRPAIKKRLCLAFVVLLLLLAVPAWFSYRLALIPRIDRLETFHAPVFSPNGRDVYYLTRSAWGVSWGPGIEFFTPPAAVIVLRDTFTLQRTDIGSGETKNLHTWHAKHPLRPGSQYRNYLFGVPDCELAWDGNNLHYKIGIDFLPNDPPHFTVKEWAIGAWNADEGTVVERETWRSGYYTTNRWTEQLLSGAFEIVDYKSQALILDNAEDRTRTTLRASRTAGAGLLREIENADLKDYTHRAELERSRTIRESYAAAVSSFKAEGLPEGEAMLKANDEMEKKGFYPKTPKLIAARMEGPQPGAAVFTISSDEFRFGLFQDIEKALASPGTEVRFWGGYITHRDFDTSKKLNEYLAAGNKTFMVRTDKGLFLVTLQ